MATSRAPARVKNVRRSRHFLAEKAIVSESSQVLSSSQSPYPVGSQYSAETLLFAARDLSANAREWIQKHDKYTVDQLELFCTLTSSTRGTAIDKNLPIEVYFYEDTDADPATQTSWIRTQDRDNIGKVVLNAFNPTARLIKFKPTITLEADASLQSPANIIPPKGTFVDALSLNQKFSGVRVFACCPAADAQGQSYDFKLNFTWRAKILAKQPL